MAKEVYIKICETVDGVERARYEKLADNKDYLNLLLTRKYNVFNRARVGTGGSAASAGQIQDAPCIIFNATQEQEVFFSSCFYPQVDLSTIDPILQVHFINTGAASVGNETVRLQMQLKYRANDEGIDGVYNETLTQDIELTTGIAYAHGHIDFTLDRSLIAPEDLFSVRVARMGVHANDDYPDNWGIIQIFLVYNGKGGM